MAADGRSRFELIIGLHDLSERHDARGEELDYWMPFSVAGPMLDLLVDRSRQTGVRLRITSDDGFRSDREKLMPWLIERGLTGTFFVPSRFIGLEGRLTAAHLREMSALGMEIGNHGARHVDWSKVTEAEFVEDIREGRKALEDIIGQRVSKVSTPFGGFNARVLAHLADEGFTEICTSRPGLALARVPLKPRNIMRSESVGPIHALAGRRGTLADAARVRLRPLSTVIRSWANRT